MVCFMPFMPTQRISKNKLAYLCLSHIQNMSKSGFCKFWYKKVSATCFPFFFHEWQNSRTLRSYPFFPETLFIFTIFWTLVYQNKSFKEETEVENLLSLLPHRHSMFTRYHHSIHCLKLNHKCFRDLFFFKFQDFPWLCQGLRIQGLLMPGIFHFKY